jgi:serine/threonine protein kinase
MSELVGKQLDEYRIDRLLGQGGMAYVYLATDVRLKRKAAIKVIKTPLSADPEYVKRFEREAQAVARLEHPHIIRLYRYGKSKGLLYMAMQYVEGPDLKSLLATYRQNQDFIDLKDATQILRDVCTALDYAHGQGVIHRDVKPSNIIVDNQGRAYLMDFGLARMSGVSTAGKIFGSAHYMAPEHAISSAATTPLSDFYAVGVILYEMLTGQRPFEAANLSDVALKQMGEQPRPPRALRPSISRELEAVVLKTLSKTPEERYPNGTTLVEALARAQKGPGKAVVSDVPTLVSRASIAERIREAAVPALPPVPAAAVAPESILAVPSPLTKNITPGRRQRARKRLALLLIVLLLALLAGLAVVLNSKGGEKSGNTPTTNTQQDADGDGVLDDADGCPDVAGLPIADGCVPDGVVKSRQNANLRSGPGEGYKILGVLHPGEAVEVQGRNPTGDWLRIRAYSSGVEAWVFYNLIETSIPLGSLPVVEVTPGA